MNKFRPDDLSKFGLSNHESRIYTALIKHGVCTMTELAQLADVPRTKVYPNVKKMERKGFVELLPDKPARCRAVPPDKVFDQLVKDREREYQEMSSLLESLNQFYRQSSNTHGMERREFWSFPDRKHALELFRKDLSSAKQEVLCVLNPNGIRMVTEHQDILRKCKENKVSVRLLVQFVSSELERLSDLSNYFDINLITRELGDNLVLIDSKLCYMFSGARISENYGNASFLLIPDERVTENVRSFVNNFLWSQGMTVDAVRKFVTKNLGNDMIKMIAPSVFLNSLVYSFSKWILDKHGKREGLDALRKISAETLRFLEEQGLVLASDRIRPSLRTVEALASLFGEDLAFEYDEDDPSGQLTVTVQESMQFDYREDALKNDVQLTFWGLLTEGVFQKLDHETTTIQTVSDPTKNQWIILKRALKKGVKIKSLDEALEQWGKVSG